MIHPTAIIHPDTTIHDSAEIGPYCVIGSDHGPCRIGAGSIIRSHSIVEGGSILGDRLDLGHHALIRTGNTVGTNLRLGSYSSLEGGAEIGDFVRIHGRAELTGGIFRDFARMYAGSYLTDNRLPPSRVNQPAIMDQGAILCINCTVIAGVRIGIGSFVGAGTVVARDVPDAMALVGGRLKRVNELEWQGTRGPWTNHFREYPDDAQPRLARLHDRIMASLAA